MSYNPFQYNSPEQFASTPSTPAFPLWELEQEPSSTQQEPQQPQVFVPTIRVPDRVPRASEGQFRLRDYVHQPAIQQSEPEDPQPSGSHSNTSHAGQPVRTSGRQRARDTAHPYARPTESQSSTAMRTRRELQASETGSLRLSIPGASSITLGCPAQGHNRASSTVPDATRYAGFSNFSFAWSSLLLRRACATFCFLLILLQFRNGSTVFKFPTTYAQL